ncbi:hypothetical protein J6TS2_26430 [Heyndrickxia sporothermodurans]|nr:hypothetical protein J6TS2_26430 [Heyndrickxia sporothermodurans]
MISFIFSIFAWKVNKKDPSTYHFIWNIRPNDQVSSIQFYFNKNRGYHVTDGIEKYDPKIQMMKEILIQEKPFGFMKIPKDWVSVMKAVQKVELEKRKFDNMFPHPVISFGWLPKDKTGKEAELNHIFNENGFDSYGDELESLLILSGEEIEFSSR